MPATLSRVGDASFNDNFGPYQPDAEFSWPFCPLKTGGAEDFRVYTKGPVSGGFSYALDGSRAGTGVFHGIGRPPRAFCSVMCGGKKIFRGWLAGRSTACAKSAPWNGNAITCGMEFGVSPLVESRRKMVERGSLFGVPGYRWMPARSAVTVEYCAFITTAIPAAGVPDEPFPLGSPARTGLRLAD